MVTLKKIILILVVVLWLVNGTLTPAVSQPKNSIIKPQSGKRPTIGLVLSGGGAKGLAHVGVLKVLEEIGLPIDYIGGTSMGGIVGGLYAIGYSAARLENLAQSLDWDELLEDRMPRRSISIEEKEEDGKYVTSFPIRQGRIGLPAGLIAGQKMSALLSRLTWPVHHVDDFRDFAIPFLCVATDIVTGKAVVLDKGYLPDALRASMAIPTVFTPIELNNRLLVDGGVVRNLPASDVKEMGADIIIGVDVTAPLYRKDELNSLAKIMEQAASFQYVASIHEQRQYCDILIRPDVLEYTASSFDAVDSLLLRGERAARQQWQSLKALADSLKQYPLQTEKFIPATKIDSLHITDLEIVGLRRASRELVLGKFKLEIPGWINPEELERAIDRIYGTNFFERVTHKFEPTENGVKLIIRVTERQADLFKVGLHYDSEKEAAVLLNTTFLNILGHGTRLLLNAKLSEHLAFNGSYFMHTNWNPGLGVGLQLDYNRFDFAFYDANKLAATFKYSAKNIEFIFQTIFSNSFALGASLRRGSTALEPIVVPGSWPFRQNELGLNSLAGFIKVDTFDRTFYPSSGVQLYTEARIVPNWLNYEKVKTYSPFQRYFLNYQAASFLRPQVSFTTQIFAGICNGKQLPQEYLFYTGGLVEYRHIIFPFIGLDFMQVADKNLFTTQIGFQFEPWDDRFIILRGGLGKAEPKPAEILNSQNWFYGYGLTLGALTPVGPMEITIMQSSEKAGWLTHLSIGSSF